MPRIVGDPIDPLRIGPPRGGGGLLGGPPGNLVGPNSGIFNPDGSIGGGPYQGGGLDPSLGG